MIGKKEMLSAGLILAMLAMGIVSAASPTSSSSASKPSTASAPETRVSLKELEAILTFALYADDATPEDLRKFWQDAAKVGLTKAALDVAQTPVVESERERNFRRSDKLRQCAERGCFDEFKDVAEFRKAYMEHGLAVVIPMIDLPNIDLKDVLDLCKTVSGIPIVAEWGVLSPDDPVTMKMENATVREVLDAMVKSLGRGARWRVEIDSAGVPKIVVSAGSAASAATSKTAASAATTRPSTKEMRAFYAVMCYSCSMKAEPLRKFWRDARASGLAKAAEQTAPVDMPVDDIFGRGGKTTATELLRRSVNEGGFDGYKNVDEFRKAYVECYLETPIPKCDFTNLSLKDTLDFFFQACGIPVICDWESVSRPPVINLQMENTTIREILKRVVKQIGPEASWRLDTDPGGIPVIVIEGKTGMRLTSDKDF